MCWRCLFLHILHAFCIVYLWPKFGVCSVTVCLTHEAVLDVDNGAMKARRSVSGRFIPVPRPGTSWPRSPRCSPKSPAFRCHCVKKMFAIYKKSSDLRNVFGLWFRAERFTPECLEWTVNETIPYPLSRVTHSGVREPLEVPSSTIGGSR